MVTGLLREVDVGEDVPYQHALMRSLTSAISIILRPIHSATSGQTALPIPLTKSTFELFYGDASWTSSIPKKSILTEIGPRRDVRRTYEWVSLDTSVTPPEETFGLKGLEIPVGEMVTDERINRLLGYWNGSEIVKNRSDAVKQAAAVEADGNRPRTMNWPLILGIAIDAMVLALAIRRLSRRARI